MESIMSPNYGRLLKLLLKNADTVLFRKIGCFNIILFLNLKYCFGD